MTTKSMILVFAACAYAIAWGSGCVSTRALRDPAILSATPRPAFSMAMQQTDIVVAVSPVRQTMQIGGSIPTLLGAGVSAVQDGQHARTMKEALGEYDPCLVFTSRLESRLREQFGDRLERVAPMGTTAGYSNAREARQARIDGLRRAGFDVTLDLDLSFGIYGPQGILALKIDGELVDVSSGRTEWRNSIAWYSEALFADTRWRDPMQRMTPNITAPRLTVAGDAVDQWTADDAAPFRAAFEDAVDALVAAVLTDLGLDESPEGLYTLGAQLLLRGRNAEAAERFSRALALLPEYAEAANGLALALARDKQLDAALELGEKVAAARPDYLPIQYNLAWWHGVENKNPEAARPYYERALELGASPSRRLERVMDTP